MKPLYGKGPLQKPIYSSDVKGQTQVFSVTLGKKITLLKGGKTWDGSKKDTINVKITAPVTAKRSRIRVKGMPFLNPAFTKNHNNTLYKINLKLGIGWHLCSNHSGLLIYQQHLSLLMRQFQHPSALYSHNYFLASECLSVCVSVSVWECVCSSSGRPRWMDVRNGHRIVCSYPSLPNRSPPCCVLQTGAQL